MEVVVVENHVVILHEVNTKDPGFFSDGISVAKKSNALAVVEFKVILLWNVVMYSINCHSQIRKVLHFIGTFAWTRKSHHLVVILAFESSFVEFLFHPISTRVWKNGI